MEKPVVLCIMDGWGLSDDKKGNSPLLANTPTIDFLRDNFPFTKLRASGKAVGLPEGQMGNSEVGHINLGAGRIVYTGLSLINHSFEIGEFESKPEVLEMFSLLKERGSKFHILALISEGGVHSSMQHVFNFMEICGKKNIPYILHGFTDGRDVSPNAAIEDFKRLMKKIKETNGQLGVISGRYFAMDRDKNWDRTESVYRYLLGEDCNNLFECPIDYISKSYFSGVTDEFIKPAINKNLRNGLIQDNDLVVFFNFRPDRAKQLSHLLVGSKNLYDYKPAKSLKNIALFALMDYENINLKNVLFPPFNIKNTLGEVLSKNKKKQLRIAETEKYPHVTHFFDGGKTLEYEGMKKILIPSPKVATYDLKPEMSAPEITVALLKELSTVDAVILNFANPDMVGHTGSLEATVKACEVVDAQIKKIYDAVNKLGGIMIVIADHGNAEVMITKENTPHTAHTTNLVPCIITKPGLKLRDDGILADISPTMLDLLGLIKPSEMTGKSLIIS